MAETQNMEMPGMVANEDTKDMTGIGEDPNGKRVDDPDYGVGAEVLCKKNGVWYPAIVMNRTYRMRKDQRITMYKLQLDGWSTTETTEGNRRLLPRTEKNMAMSVKSMAGAARHELPVTSRSSQPRSPKQQSNQIEETPLPIIDKNEIGRISHPSYAEMICRALSELIKKGSKSGVSAIRISQWIKTNYTVHPTKYKVSVNTAIKQGIKQGRFVKIKNSYRLSPKEIRARDKGKGKIIQQHRTPPKPRLLDDQVYIKQQSKDKLLPMPQFVLSQSPAECAGPILLVAEFCHAFERVLFHNFIPENDALEPQKDKDDETKLSGTKRKRGTGSKNTRRNKPKNLIGVADLDCALSLLPLPYDHLEIRLPPLLERLVLSLLRHICGRFPRSGEFIPDPQDIPHRLEFMLYVGHRQNRYLWGQCLNAATWPDILRRHLAAERRYRQRLNQAYPPLVDTNNQDGTTLEEKKKSTQEILEEALIEFCDNKKSFGALKPEQCAAILKSLVDDVLATGPALYDALNVAEKKTDEYRKRLKLVENSRKKLTSYLNQEENEIPKRIADDPLLQTVKNKVSALEALEEINGQFSIAKKTQDDWLEHNYMRRDAFGSDRFHSRYWGGIQSIPAPCFVSQKNELQVRDIKFHLKPASSERLVVRLSDQDERYNFALDPWCAVDLGSRDPFFRHALDIRGRRENALFKTLFSQDDSSPPAIKINGRTSAAKRRELEEAILQVGDVLSESVRNRLQMIKQRPPARDSPAALMPWPAPLDRDFEIAMNQFEANELNDEEENPADEEDMQIEILSSIQLQPRRSTRIVARESEQSSTISASASASKKKLTKSEIAKEKEDEKALEARSVKAGDDMAPFRQRFPTIAHALFEFRIQIDKFHKTLDTVANLKTAGKKRSKSPQEDYSTEENPQLGKAVDLYQNNDGENSNLPLKERFLAALCRDAKRLEQKLTALSVPEDQILFEQMELIDKEKDENTPPVQQKSGNEEDEDRSDFVEKDSILENDYYALSGPGSDIPHHRELWHKAIDACVSTQKDEDTFEARASAFATLYGFLAEVVAQRTVLIEAWSISAANVLESESRLTSTVFIPSDPKPGFVWARIRGYPWWPAREYIPKSPHFAQALERRNHKLLVFVNESVMYLIDSNSVEPFTGLPDDPRMPKSIKQCAKGLQLALTIVKAVQQKEDLPTANGESSTPQGTEQNANTPLNQPTTMDLTTDEDLKP
uniref:Histone H1 n=1 Tax=Aureoumbra lagunensis TaxID=44058 RepID=A0A7S3JYV4_9STRA|mmetsp:Transcript_17842/g.23265  ORF Transcript_17842/g.23265 Transcript_17842/m.23265 type:complete len:1225 (+) Transcript_17842:84-3758(+)